MAGVILHRTAACVGYAVVGLVLWEIGAVGWVALNNRLARTPKPTNG